MYRVLGKCSLFVVATIELLIVDESGTYSYHCATDCQVKSMSQFRVLIAKR
jgi:hypothetical protein